MDPLSQQTNGISSVLSKVGNGRYRKHRETRRTPANELGAQADCTSEPRQNLQINFGVEQRCWRPVDGHSSAIGMSWPKYFVSVLCRMTFFGCRTGISLSRHELPRHLSAEVCRISGRSHENRHAVSF